MFNLKNLKFSTKILLLGTGSVLITVLVLVAMVVWQSSQFNALAQDQVSQLADSDLSHITEGVYNMVKAQDDLVQQVVNYDLNVARQVLNNAGQVSLANDKVQWTAVNQFTQQPVTVQLPKMLVGGNWLGQNTDPSVGTPVVDEAESLVGGTATIFQRMNEQGDMLRVATTVKTTDGQRAVGTYIPATNPDGTPNPVVSTVLAGKTYRGDAFVVNAWYDTAYEPILNDVGEVMGMLYVGVKQQNVDSLRQAILRTQVGKTGYVYVVGSDGSDRGRYIISQQGQRDGENIWEQQDAEGHYVTQSIINKALTLKPGETALERYQWQNPGEPAPRWKIARIAYYAPWHWVIGASTYEDELQTYRSVLQEGQLRMSVISGALGLVIALIAGFLSVFLARSISRPVGHLVNVANQITAGNLDVTAEVAQQDEIGLLATTFNVMTAQLHKLIGTLERRVVQLRSSADVGRAASSILDVKPLLDQIVALITERFGFYYAAVFTLNEARDYAVLRAATGEAGRILQERGHRLAVDNTSMVGATIITHHARIALDVGNEAVRFANPLLPNTRSEIALPLIVGERVVGAMDVQSEQAEAFDEASAEVLQAMADQIAIALQNAESFSRSEQQTRTLTQLNQLSRDLALATSLEGIARATSTAVVNLIGPNVMSLALKSVRPDQYAVRLLSLDSEAVLGAAQLMPATNTLVGLAIGRGETQYVADLAEVAAQYQDAAIMSQDGLRSLVALPLHVQERTLGAFTSNSTRPHAYSLEQINQLEQVAAQLAVTLDNFNLAEQTRQALSELDAANRRLIGQAWEQYMRSHEQLSAEWREGEWNKHQNTGMAAEDQDSLANLRLPIKVRGQTIGEFTIRSADGQLTWTSEDIAFAQSLVDQTSQMIENARLLEETERLAHREQRIRGITTRIRAANDIRGVLEATATELAQSMGVPRAIVRLTMGDKT